MNRKFALIICCIGAFGLLLAGCNKDSESNRSVVTVALINDGVPLAADVYDAGDPADPLDDGIPEDWVPIIFYNRPYSTAVITGEGLPYNEFLVTGYEVTFERTDGGDPAELPPPIVGALSLSVPSGEEAISAVLVVPFGAKLTPPMVALRTGGEILAIAHMEFTGHEVGSSTEWTIPASLSVNFGNFADEED